MKHLKYLWYVVRHKWFVFVTCCGAGIPWPGVIHDWSKFHPSEWGPYAEFFYGKSSRQRRDETGYYKPSDTGDSAFDFAWLLHQKRNKHHWQWWVLPRDDGSTKVFPMSDKYLKEMVCDWRGAGKAQGKPNTLAWYKKNKGKMQLHPETRAWIEAELGLWSIKQK